MVVADLAVTVRPSGGLGVLDRVCQLLMDLGRDRDCHNKPLALLLLSTSCICHLSRDFIIDCIQIESSTFALLDTTDAGDCC